MEQPIEPLAQPKPPKAYAARWRVLLGLLMTGGVIWLVVYNWAWLIEALGLARDAQPIWLAAALAVILASYMVSGQVFRVALRAQGYRIGTLRAWLTALVAIIISQSMPAGGVGSYAFLVTTFRRRGVALGTTALVATLELISYSSAMTLIALFSLIYLSVHSVTAGVAGAAFVVPLLIGLSVIAVLVIGAIGLAQGAPALARRLQPLGARLARLSGHPGNRAWVRDLAERIGRGRALMIENRSTLAGLIGIQLLALCGHSLAMLLILLSLGVHTSFAVVLAAFGAALITSLFNVLPGGGGTIETILAAVLGFLAVGPAAIPAAIIFRLLNFWLLLPGTALAYVWLTRERTRRNRTVQPD